MQRHLDDLPRAMLRTKFPKTSSSSQRFLRTIRLSCPK
jgi:hypothetical protein